MIADQPPLLLLQSEWVTGAGSCILLIEKRQEHLKRKRGGGRTQQEELDMARGDLHLSSEEAQKMNELS